jgi:hypothetical protein
VLDKGRDGQRWNRESVEDAVLGRGRERRGKGVVIVRCLFVFIVVIRRGEDSPVRSVFGPCPYPGLPGAL